MCWTPTSCTESKSVLHNPLQYTKFPRASTAVSIVSPYTLAQYWQLLGKYHAPFVVQQSLGGMNGHTL